MAKKKRPKKPQPLTEEQKEAQALQKAAERNERHLRVFRHHDAPETRARVPSEDVTWLSGVDAARLDIVKLGNSQRQALLRAPNCALRAYRFRKQPLITQEEYAAALCLFLDYEESQLSQAMAADPARDPIGSSIYRDFMPARLDAEHRCRAALLAVHGVGRIMLRHVCCEAKALSEDDFPPYTDGKKKMARFKEALAELINHYKKHPEGPYCPFT